MFWICNVIGGFILGAVGGFVVGAILGAAGVGTNNIKVICGGVAFILTIPLSYILFRVFVDTMIIKKAQKSIQDMMQESPNHALEGQISE